MCTVFFSQTCGSPESSPPFWSFFGSTWLCRFSDDLWIFDPRYGNPFMRSSIKFLDISSSFDHFWVACFGPQEPSSCDSDAKKVWFWTARVPQNWQILVKAGVRVVSWRFWMILVWSTFCSMPGRWLGGAGYFQSHRWIQMVVMDFRMILVESLGTSTYFTFSSDWCLLQIDVIDEGLNGSK